MLAANFLRCVYAVATPTALLYVVNVEQERVNLYVDEVNISTASCTRGMAGSGVLNQALGAVQAVAWVACGLSALFASTGARAKDLFLDNHISYVQSDSARRQHARIRDAAWEMCRGDRLRCQE
jgi:hypothetical protein